MTVRLIKQKQKTDSDEKTNAQPSSNQVMITTLGWVKEFKKRKAERSEMFNLLAKQS